MSSVVYLRALADPSRTPCLALVDLQREYTADTRAMAMPEASIALNKCRMALRHARSMGFPIAYFRQVIQSSYFNPATVFSGWIKGFEPTGADMIYDRSQPSCYSNKSFAEFMDSCDGHFVLAGFAGETACLSTAIDAFHRKHRFTYLSDASASHKLGTLSAPAVQGAVTEIIRVYGEVLETDAWIDSTSDVAMAGGSRS